MLRRVNVRGDPVVDDIKDPVDGVGEETSYGDDDVQTT